jgi:prolyl-tRNA synthetase
MPSLHPREIWDATGRWNTVDVLYKLKVNERDFALGPTHEEVVTPLASMYIKSYKDLPQAVYQIQTKFRAEARPKSGLLRGREFRMKDLYSFHATSLDLDEYYEKVKTAYVNTFKRCGLGDITYLTYASGGVFSRYSHEYQTITPYGEDTIYLCEMCKVAINNEIIAEQTMCPQCKNTDLKSHKAIEVGNIFKLMTRFSDAFNLTFTDAEGKQNPVIMGCYGLGTSRLVGAIVEVLHDERGILWPYEVAPYKVHLISLVRDAQDREQADKLYRTIANAGISVLYDDRTEVSAGEKFADSDLLGMPTRVVVSAKTLAAQSVEVKARTKNELQIVGISDLLNYLNERK